MLVTEEEAKTKWCPFARVATIEGGRKYIAPPPVYNRVVFDGVELSADLKSACCVASTCMAWRTEMIGGFTHMETGETHGEAPSGKGYCGLAGKQ